MVDPSMLLERKGLKITPQRYAILKFLQHTTIHPTADEVIEQLNHRAAVHGRSQLVFEVIFVRLRLTSSPLRRGLRCNPALTRRPMI